MTTVLTASSVALACSLGAAVWATRRLLAASRRLSDAATAFARHGDPARGQ